MPEPDVGMNTINENIEGTVVAEEGSQETRTNHSSTANDASFTASVIISAEELLRSIELYSDFNDLPFYNI